MASTALNIRLHTPSVALTALDRCDRCGAQAYVKAEFPAADLLFCAHHYRSNLIQLHRDALTVQGELP